MNNQDKTKNQLEKELSLSKSKNDIEKLFQLMLKTIPVAIFLTSKSHTMVDYINSHFTSLFGYTMDDVPTIGKWLELAYPDEAYRNKVGLDLNNQVVNAINDNSQLIQMESFVTCKDSSIKQIFWRGFMLDDRLLGCGMDITEEKRKEQELIAAKEKAEENENKLNSIIESTEDFIWTVDPVNFGIQSYNTAIYNYFLKNRNIEMRIGDTPDILVSSRANDWINFYKKALKLDKYEIEYETVGGTNVLYLSLNKLVRDNKIFGISVFGRNITKLKLNENELIAAKEKAEESDRLKSAFLANMSHEIRTPMNGILGFSELLKEPGLTGEQQQEYIRIIEKSGARMLNIINDIVDISKIEAGLMKVDIKEVNINENLEFLYILFKPLVEEKGMKLLFKSTLPSKEATIRTDNEKVFSILTNLVKNAIKYSKEGTIEFGYIKRDKTLEFYVKDTGIGIPKDRQSAIFERFIQADITDKMARQGAGLGLSIAKAYVEMLGGKIWVKSKAGIGSTFYFTLPYNALTEEKIVVEKVVQPQVKENQDNPGVSGLKILITEDDETSEMLINIDVEKYSKEILKASNGFEAVEVSRNNPDINLILMDIQMPLMNGYEATRQIRQFNRDVVIIAQTAFGLSGDRKKAIEAGCNDYISKPIKKDDLAALIQKYFKESFKVSRQINDR